MSGNVRKWPEMVSKKSGNDILLAYINFYKCQISYHDRSACILSPAFCTSLNLVILDCFRWSNFKIFFNHGEGMEYTLVINWVILDYFRRPNLKIFFKHGEGMDYTLMINWVILDYFRWPDFKIFFNHGEGMVNLWYVESLENVSSTKIQY